MLLGVGQNAWAGDVTSLYERGTTNAWSDDDVDDWLGSGTIEISDGALKTSGGNEGYERIVSFSTQDNTILTLTATWNTGSSTGRAGGYNYLIFGDVEFRAYGTDSKGSVVINGTETQITTTQGDVRSGVWTITATINKATNEVSYSVGLSASGQTPSGTGTTAGTYDGVTMGFYKPGRITSTYQILTAIEVTEETQSVTTADYTINYVYNEATIMTTEGNTAIGNVVEAEDPITVDDVRYYIKDGETTSMTIVDGTNELNVEMRQADTYSYTVRGLDGSSNVLNASLASGSVTEGDAVTVSFPRYILSGTTLYCQNSGAVSYSTTFTPDADEYVEDITYSNSTVSNVVFYTEGEDVSGATAGTNVRASVGKMGYTGSSSTYLDVTTLAPGKYIIYMRGQNGNSAERAYSFMVGDTEVFSGSIANGTNQDAYSDEFTVSASSTLSFASEGSSASGVDYFYLVKTAESVTIASSGLSTFCSTSALDLANLPDGLTAYRICGSGIDDENYTITPTEITEAVAAGTGLLLKGTASTTYAIPTATSGTTYAFSFEDTGNLLVGVTEDTVLEAETGLILVGGTFYLNSAGTIPAGRAYIGDPANGARELKIVFGDDVTTGIERVAGAQSAAKDVYYNVAGQRVGQPTKGLYIVNGKKVVIK